jgi:tRNA 2-thiouridine synthesizing protein A
MDDHVSVESPVLVDGGDRACGELLLILAHRMQSTAPGATVRLVATDPAAVLDLPAWCHLTGHRYLGSGHQADGRAHYDLQASTTPRATRSHEPWRLHDTTSSTSARERDPNP